MDPTPFESRIALENVGTPEVLDLIDCPALCDLVGTPLPDSRSGVIEVLDREGVVTPCESGGLDVTNVGGILFARRLSRFPGLARKSVRLIRYFGADKTAEAREYSAHRGYAVGFEGLLELIDALLPAREVFEPALRRLKRVYPLEAVRELVANALIHQDLNLTGTGPMIEIFDHRIEITNPGQPLVNSSRWIDALPRSRNEKTARMMRRMGICEERGTGWDKIASLAESYLLPAPKIEVINRHTRVILFAPRALGDMDHAERLRAVYMHA